MIVICIAFLSSISTYHTFSSVCVVPRNSIDCEKANRFNVRIIKKTERKRKPLNIKKLKSKWNIVVKKKVDYFSTFGFFTPIYVDQLDVKWTTIPKKDFVPKKVKIKTKEVPLYISDFDQGIQKAKYENKLVLVEFGAKWCVPCQIFEEYTLALPNIKSFLTENYIVKHVDIESFDGVNLKNVYNIKLLPTIIIMDGNKNVLDRYEEGLSGEKLINVLESNKTNYNQNYLRTTHYL